MRMLGANRALAKRGKSTIRDKHTHWLHRLVRLIVTLSAHHILRVCQSRTKQFLLHDLSQALYN